MAVHIFNLRNVPEDEADDIRQLLETNRIEYYETPAGRWGMSAPGLWVTDDTQRDRAKELLARYQEERALRARQQYAEQLASGQHRSLWDSIKAQPLRFTGVLLAIGFVVYVSLTPFLNLIAG